MGGVKGGMYRLYTAHRWEAPVTQARKYMALLGIMQHTTGTTLPSNWVR